MGFCIQFSNKNDWLATGGLQYCIGCSSRKVCTKRNESINLSGKTRFEFESCFEEGRKDDGKKDRWDLFPWEQVEDVVRVLTHGAEKYKDDNWQKVPNPKNRYFAALHRHLVAYRKGERFNPESGLPHLAHAACNALFLSWFEAKQ